MRKFYALVFLIAFSSIGYASQEKVIQSKGVQAYESNSESSPVLEKFSKGDVVKTSNEAKDHWFKVLLINPKGGKKFGWVHEKHFAAATTTKELKEAGVDRVKKKAPQPTGNRWTMGFTADVSLLESEANVTFPTAGSLGYLYGIEAGYKPNIDLTLITRLGAHSYSPYSISGYTVMIGLDYAFIHYLPWKLSFALLGGYSISTNAAGVIKSKVTQAESFNTPDILGKLVLRRYLNQRFSVLVEGGWRYFVKKGAVLGGKSVDFDLTAPIAGLGIQMDF